MKSFSDKTEIRKSKLFDRVTLENESKINKRVGSNKNMYAGKNVKNLSMYTCLLSRQEQGME